MRREAARLLFALSLNELNKLDVAGVDDAGGSSDGGGVGEGNPATAEVATDLVALARSDDPSCARNAVGALANLSENDATHERLLGWGAGFLSKLALENGGEGDTNAENANGGSADGMVAGGDGQMEARASGGGMDVGLVREVTRCLANLAGNYATHEKLLDGGAADALVGSLKREDAVTARFAALGLANLAGQVGGVVPNNEYKLFLSKKVGRWQPFDSCFLPCAHSWFFYAFVVLRRGNCRWSPTDRYLSRGHKIASLSREFQS